MCTLYDCEANVIREILVRFPNPLDIQIHVSWGTRLLPTWVVQKFESRLCVAASQEEEDEEEEQKENQDRHLKYKGAGAFHSASQSKEG